MALTMFSRELSTSEPRSRTTVTRSSSSCWKVSRGISFYHPLAEPALRFLPDRLRRVHRARVARAATRARAATVTASGPALKSRAATAARAAEAGTVKPQAQTMRRATPHLTALNRRVAPAPITEPETTCVVLTGNPHAVASWITDAATVWAANP